MNEYSPGKVIPNTEIKVKNKDSNESLDHVIKFTGVAQFCDFITICIPVTKTGQHQERSTTGNFILDYLNWLRDYDVDP